MKDIVLNKDAFDFSKFTYSEDFEKNFPATENNYKFVFLTEGSLTAKTEKSTITISENQLLFVPPELAYSLSFIKDTKGILLNFKYWPDVTNFAYPIQKIQTDDTLLESIKIVPISEDIVDSRFIWRSYQFLDEVQKYMTQNNSKNTKKIQKAINFMRENDNYSIPDLAKMCNMSESRFYIVFNEIIGMTPIKMKHKIQTEKAENLLATTTLSIDEISQKVGFESTAHFRKVFANCFGLSPKQYRKNLNQ